MSYVGYFEVNKEYIINKYCVNKSTPKLKCNGKCHLSKQLKLTSVNTLDSSENQFKAMLSGFKNIFTPLFYSELNTDLELVSINKFYKVFDYSVKKEYSFYPSLTSPPPRV